MNAFAAEARARARPPTTNRRGGPTKVKGTRPIFQSSRDDRVAIVSSQAISEQPRPRRATNSSLDLRLIHLVQLALINTDYKLFESPDSLESLLRVRSSASRRVILQGESPRRFIASVPLPLRVPRETFVFLDTDSVRNPALNLYLISD